MILSFNPVCCNLSTNCKCSDRFPLNQLSSRLFGFVGRRLQILRATEIAQEMVADLTEMYSASFLKFRSPNSQHCASCEGLRERIQSFPRSAYSGCGYSLTQDSISDLCMAFTLPPCLFCVFCLSQISLWISLTRTFAI